MSILKPLKGVDPNLEKNLRSFLEIKSAIPFEVLFSIEDPHDPSTPLVLKLMREYPHVRIQLFQEICFISGVDRFGMNPKLRNLAASYEASHYDAVLISDSNVIAPPQYLDEITSHLRGTTGLVTSIVAGTEPKNFWGFLECMTLNTFYARFMALSNRYVKPCVMGKSMLFRKSMADRFGGIEVLSHYLAEDYMAGEAMIKLGLKVRTSSIPIPQVVGHQTFKSYFDRHLRWGLIRKRHAPIAFAFEPFTQLTAVTFFACIAQMKFEAILLAIAIYYIFDFIQFARLSKFTLRTFFTFPMVWCIRELLALPIWIGIALKNHVLWRGQRFIIDTGGIFENHYCSPSIKNRNCS